MPTLLEALLPSMLSLGVGIKRRVHLDVNCFRKYSKELTSTTAGVRHSTFKVRLLKAEALSRLRWMDAWRGLPAPTTTKKKAAPATPPLPATLYRLSQKKKKGLSHRVLWYENALTTTTANARAWRRRFRRRALLSSQGSLLVHTDDSRLPTRVVPGQGGGGDGRLIGIRPGLTGASGYSGSHKRLGHSIPECKCAA